MGMMLYRKRQKAESSPVEQAESSPVEQAESSPVEDTAGGTKKAQKPKKTPTAKD